MMLNLLKHKVFIVCLILLFSMMLGVTVFANEIEYSYSLSDSYGDGWNGAKIIIIDNTSGDEEVETITLNSGSSDEGVFSLIFGHTYSFQWVSGSYDSECDFTLKDGNDETIYSSESDGLPTNNNIFIVWEVGDIIETTCVVTFNPNGGSVTPTSKEIEKNGQYGELPTPVREGEDVPFLGWFKNRLSAGAHASRDDDYYNQYVIRITPHSSLNNHNYTHYLHYGDVIVFDVTITDDDAEINGLDLNDSQVPTTDYQISSDKKHIHGVIEITDTYDIAYVLDFIDIHLSDEAPDYTVNEFSIYQTKVTATNAVENKNHTLIAGWGGVSTMTYTVSFQSNGGSDVPSQIIESGEKAAEPADPENGELYFIGWFENPTVDTIYKGSGELVSYNTFDFANTAITDDVELTALWVATATVNTSGEGSGQIEFAPADQELVFDEEYPYTSAYINAVIGFTNEMLIGAKAKEYNIFVKWTKDGEDYSTNETITETITANTEYVAVFEPIKCTITFNANSGDGEMEEETVHAGTEYTLPACSFTAPAGKVFDKWDLGRKGAKITVTEDMELVAQWKDKPKSSGGSSVASYKITTEAENATITPTLTSMRRNETQEFQFTADDGYEIVDVFIDGQSVGAVDCYTLEKVTEKHTIEVKTAKMENRSGDDSTDQVKPVDKFTDVKAKDWFYEYVNYVVENDLFHGTSETTFSPNLNISRGMLVTVLYRLAGATDTATATFSDVDANQYYSAPIAWASKKGIVEGIGNHEFAPDKPITREDLATMIYRYIKLQGKGFTGSWMFLLEYEDRNEISDYAYEPICWLTMNQILTRKEENRIAPKELVTRAETAKIIQMVAELIK